MDKLNWKEFNEKFHSILFKADKIPCMIKADMLLIITIIANLSLSLKHPENKGASSKAIRQFISGIFNNVPNEFKEIISYLMKDIDNEDFLNEVKKL